MPQILCYTTNYNEDIRAFPTLVLAAKYLKSVGYFPYDLHFQQIVEVHFQDGTKSAADMLKFIHKTELSEQEKNSIRIKIGNDNYLHFISQGIEIGEEWEQEEVDREIEEHSWKWKDFRRKPLILPQNKVVYRYEY